MVRNTDVKQGDTLIEVTLAIGIFSLIAVGVVSVVSGSSSRAQLALEQTLTREEIDAQAEALRFIQSSYATGKKSGDTENSQMGDLWHTITAQVNKTEQATDDLLKFQPSTCAEIYDGTTLANQKAFIINTRKLNSLNPDAVVVQAKTANLFYETETYPHLSYGGLADSDPLLEDRSAENDTLQRALGIYIVGVQDPDSTNIVSVKNGSTRISKVSAYYDFYIRACWYRTGAERPTTISTVIRLHDPDSIEVIEPEPEPSDDNPCAKLGYQTMQNWKNTALSGFGDSTRLCDSRDGHIYRVAKLSDGRIWMTEDMALDIKNAKITSENTNHPSSEFLQKAKTAELKWYAWTTSEPAIPTANFTLDEMWCGLNTEACINSIRYTFNLGWALSHNSCQNPDGSYNPSACFATMRRAVENKTNEGGYKYNYYTATAGNGNYSASSGTVSGDICPAGWRLPTGGGDGELTQLINSYTQRYPTDRLSPLYPYWLDAPYYFGYNRMFADDSIMGNPLSTWSSLNTGPTSAEAIYYRFNQNIVNGRYLWESSANKYDGLDVRCTLADSTLYPDIDPNPEPEPVVNEKIQNLSSSKCTTSLKKVYDSRDQQIYTVQRLRDGKCWMMENLRLGADVIVEDLTSSNTNFNGTITAASFQSKRINDESGIWGSEYMVEDIRYHVSSGSDSVSKTPYGVLYNYTAATALTIKGTSTNANATSDLCPAGWRLPTAGDNGEFKALYEKYNSFYEMRTSANNNGAAFALAGTYTYQPPNGYGSYGTYWSSTKLRGYESSEVYTLTLKSSSTTGSAVYPGATPSSITSPGINSVLNGGSIRCVLKE